MALVDICQIVESALEQSDELPADEYVENAGYSHPLNNPVASGTNRAENKIEPVMNDMREEGVHEPGKLLWGVFDSYMSEYHDGRPLTLDECFGAMEWIASRWVLGDIGEQYFTEWLAENRGIEAEMPSIGEYDEATNVVDEKGYRHAVYTQSTQPSIGRVPDWADYAWWIPNEIDKLGMPIRLK